MLRLKTVSGQFTPGLRSNIIYFNLDCDPMCSILLPTCGGNLPPQVGSRIEHMGSQSRLK